jgi:hypothetical protein
MYLCMFSESICEKEYTRIIPWDQPLSSHNPCTRKHITQGPCSPLCQVFEAYILQLGIQRRVSNLRFSFIFRKIEIYLLSCLKCDACITLNILGDFCRQTRTNRIKSVIQIWKLDISGCHDPPLRSIKFTINKNCASKKRLTE